MQPKRLATLAEIAALLGKSVSTLETYRRLRLISGFRFAKSMGRGKGRVALYDVSLIRSEVEEVEAGLSKRKSLDEIARERGAAAYSGFNFTNHESLSDLVTACGSALKPTVRRRLQRAAEFAARQGMFGCEVATMAWLVQVGKDDVTLLYADARAREEIAEVVKGMAEAAARGSVDAAIVYAFTAWKLRNLTFVEPDFGGTEKDEKSPARGRESAALAREIERLEIVLKRCRERGTAYPSFEDGTRTVAAGSRP